MRLQGILKLAIIHEAWNVKWNALRFIGNVKDSLLAGKCLSTNER